MRETIQIIADIATILGSIGLIGIALQVWVSYKQIKSDHERSRREKSVEMIMKWTDQLQREGSLARKILESLNEEQSREIHAQQKVKISNKHEKLLKQFFESEIQSESGDLVLSEAQSIELRWHALQYLNTLESILVAWQYSIVDREIIEIQFAYLFKPSRGHAALKHFRTAAGGMDSYPAIEIFSNHIEEQRKKNLRQKADVI
jgi:hypothetical protein